ncbi:MAG TPA: hypothetical protein VGF06_04415, partial [Terriglobales bacterium]
MTSRIRFLITAVFVCHLLLAPQVVTSQLRAPNSENSSPLPNLPSAAQGEEVTFRSLEQEKQGPLYTLRGQAEVHYSTYVLYADEITYNADTG